MKWTQKELDGKLCYLKVLKTISQFLITLLEKKLSVLIMFLETEILYFVVGTWDFW